MKNETEINVELETTMNQLKVHPIDEYCFGYIKALQWVLGDGIKNEKL